MSNLQHEIIRFGDVQEIAVITPRKLDSYSPHWHNSAEFVLALQDGCFYRIEDQGYHLSRGDLLLIWPRELHELVCSPENSILFIQFSANLLENNRDLTVFMQMQKLPNLIKASAYPEITDKLARMMWHMAEFYESSDFFRETRCKLLVYEMLLLLMEQVNSAKIRNFNLPTFSHDTWAYVQKACTYIDAHFTEDLRQNQVADAVGVSSYYFSRIFKSYLQMSFPEYLARVRVHEAVRLLCNSNISITECAYQAGFQSITVFNKAFLENTGSTPREYRHLYQSTVEKTSSFPARQDNEQ